MNGWHDFFVVIGIISILPLSGVIIVPLLAKPMKSLVKKLSIVTAEIDDDYIKNLGKTD